MITLKDMNQDEFVDYRSIFINEYAQDLQENRGYATDRARVKAAESIDTILTQGVATPANQLWCIQHLDEPKEIIGFLWLSITGASAWISDFYIYSNWRSRGYGSLALSEMKRLLTEIGIHEVELRVAPDNAAAKALYEKQGFNITGINMSLNKQLNERSKKMLENPTLHLLCGKIASGKSTLSAKLGASPNTVIISEDHWLAVLFGNEMQSISDYVQFSAKLRNAMKPHLVSLLKAGLSVVLDFPANTQTNREWMMSIIRESGASNRLHYLNVSDEVCRSRLRARNAEGTHDFSASDKQFEIITRYFSEPATDEGFDIIEYN